MLIGRLEEDGITPRQKLEALMCSANDQIALKAAESLARLGADAPTGGAMLIHYRVCPNCGNGETIQDDEAAL